MSVSIFPTRTTLPGLAYPVERSINFSNRKQTNVAGKELVIAEWSTPRYQWKLVFNLLRQGDVWGAMASDFTEFSTLWSFYEARKGGFDSFLYTDDDDNSVTSQAIGTGTGSQTVFPLVRTFGSTANFVLAPRQIGSTTINLSAATTTVATGVTVNGVNTSVSVTPWDTTNSNGPGQVIFGAAPANGAAIALSSMSYYWPVRFSEDQCVFEGFASGYYRARQIVFASIK